MTIFLDIILEQLEQEILKIKTTSLSEDHSFGNRVVSIFSYKTFGRNLSLAEIKRDLADKLLKDLTALKEQAAQKNIKDERVYEKIRDKILACRLEGAKKSTDFGCREGNFGSRLNKLSLFLDHVYEKLKDISFLNIPRNEDPLNIFRYYAAVYYRDKIFIAIKKINLTQSVTNLTRYGLMHGNTVAQAKDRLLSKTIKDCIRTFEELNTESREDPEVCKRYVLIHLALLEKENDKLCRENAVIDHIGFGYTLLGRFNVEVPNAQPGLGRLDTCIKNTRETLDHPMNHDESLNLIQEEPEPDSVEEANHSDEDEEDVLPSLAKI